MYRWPWLCPLVIVVIACAGSLGGDDSAAPARPDAGPAAPDSGLADGAGPEDQSPLRIEAECAHGSDLGDCAETYSGSHANTALANDDTTVGYFDAGDYLAYEDVTLAGANAMVVHYAKGNAGGSVEIRLDAVDGTLIGAFAPANTGGWNSWQQADVALALTDGVHDLYLVGIGAEGITNLDWLSIDYCTPMCEGLQCGSDGCGGSCGVCEGGFFCSAAGQCVEGGGGSILAIDAAAGMANGFNVGNTFEVGQHPTAPASVNAMIDAYYAEGFRTVRIPVRWIGSNWGDGDLASADGSIKRDHARLADLESAVDHAIGKGMYVVVNTHHEDWLFDKPFTAAQGDIFDQLWGDICDIFKDRPHGLIFEVINEPHGTINNDSAAVAALNQRSYDTIRACGGNNAERIIIIDGQDWGSPASLNATWPQVTDIPGGGNDPYLMGSIHFYAPLALTHAAGADGINTGWTEADIQNTFQAVSDWADGRLPIFVGEFGVNWDQHAHQINDNVRAWYAAVTGETRSRGWAFTVWDDGGWFRVMNRGNQQFNGLQDSCVP